MAEEIIITKFVGDTSQLDASIQKLTKDMAGYDDATVKATNDTAKFDSALGSTSAKVQVLAGGSKEAAQSVGALGNETKRSSSLLAGLGDSVKAGIGKVGGFFSDIGNKVKSFAQGAKQGFKDAFDELPKRAVPAVGKAKKEVDSLSSSLGGKLKGNLESAASRFGILGDAAVALGPVGLAIAGIATGLLKVISNTDAGATALDGFGRTGGIVFDKITGQVSVFFDRLFTGSTAFDTFAQKAGEAAQFIITKLTPVGILLDRLGAIDAFKDAAQSGQKLAQIYDTIGDNVSGLGLVTATNQVLIDKNLAALRDTTKTVEERKKIADEITATEKENLRLKTLQATAELKAAQAEQLRSKANKKGGETDALNDAVNLAAQKLKELEGESGALTERISERLNGIIAADAQTQIASAQKVQAEKDRLAKEEEARISKLSKAQADADKVAQDAANADFDAGLTENERAIVAIDRRYGDEKAATEKLYADLSALAGDDLDAQAKIAEQKKTAITDILRAQTEEVTALEKEQQEKTKATLEADNQVVFEATATKADIERQAINKQFDAAEEAAKRTITDEQALTEKLVEITKARGEAIAGVQDETAIAETEKLKQQQEARLAIINDVSNQLGALTEAAASGQIATAEEAGKALVGIALKTVGDIIAAQVVQVIAGSAARGAQVAGAPGAIAGLAAGTALAAIIKGLFAAAAAQIQGNYQGDPYVGGDGSRPQFQGRDGYLRRLDKGERVVTTKTNEKHYDLFEAAENGTLEKYIETHHTKEKRTVSEIMERKRIERYLTNVLRVENIRTEMDRSTVDAGLFKATRTGDLSTFIANNYTTRVNTYMESEQGQRATSVVFPRYFDKGIVEASNAARKEQKTTNRLLSELVEASSRKAPRQHPRY